MDSGERPGARALLGLGGARAVRALGAGQDAARCDDKDVAVGELLFEFAGEAGELDVGFSERRVRYLPLLGLVPALKKRNRDKDHNCLPAVTNLDLRILVSAI